MTAEEHFAINLKLLRESKQVSQKAVANSIGVRAATYRMWEYGKATPKIETLKSVCKYFNVTAQAMLTQTISS